MQGLIFHVLEPNLHTFLERWNLETLEPGNLIWSGCRIPSRCIPMQKRSSLGLKALPTIKDGATA